LSPDNWLIIIDGGSYYWYLLSLKKQKISNHTSTDADDFMPLFFLPEVTFQSNNILPNIRKLHN
jgi:hypothetical protein